MSNDYLFKIRTDGDIVDLEGRLLGHINLEYIKSIAKRPNCENCDLYFKAMTKEEMRKGGAEE